VLIDVAPHLLEHVAHDVLGFRLVLQDAEGDAEHPGGHQVVELGQRSLVPRPQATEQRPLLILTKTFRLAHLDFHCNTGTGPV